MIIKLIVANIAAFQDYLNIDKVTKMYCIIKIKHCKSLVTIVSYF